MVIQGKTAFTWKKIHPSPQKRRPALLQASLPAVLPPNQNAYGILI